MIGRIRSSPADDYNLLLPLSFTCQIRLPSAGLDRGFVTLYVDGAILLEDLVLCQRIEGGGIFDITRPEVKAGLKQVRLLFPESLWVEKEIKRRRHKEKRGCHTAVPSTCDLSLRKYTLA